MNMQKDSGNVERYTQPHIIEAVRKAMGGITLDPASCEAAQAIVKATHWIGLPNDGKAASWFGNVWVNWPYSRENNPLWSDKIIEEYVHNGDVIAICSITWLSGSSNWFQAMHDNCDAYCILNQRPRFIDAATMQEMPKAMKDGIVWYFGHDVRRFAEALREFGSIGRPL